MTIKVQAIMNSGKDKVDSITGLWYFSPIVNGKNTNLIAESEDVALILGLQLKYEDSNSQFCKNACRMLQIDSIWAK